jgi:hypothetical protein
MVRHTSLFRWDHWDFPYLRIILLSEFPQNLRRALPAKSIWLDQIHTKFADRYPAAMDREILGVAPVEVAEILETPQGQAPSAEREQTTNKQPNNEQTTRGVQN